MRISDWSSDVCSSDLLEQLVEGGPLDIALAAAAQLRLQRGVEVRARGFALHPELRIQPRQLVAVALVAIVADAVDHAHPQDRHGPCQRDVVSRAQPLEVSKVAGKPRLPLPAGSDGQTPQRHPRATP